MDTPATSTDAALRPSRRDVLVTLATLLASGSELARAGVGTKVEVWKSPACGCCKDWVKHLQVNGFQVQVHDMGNTDARARLGVPVKYGSSHTARVGRYAIEGHVPAREIVRLLKEQPAAVGLAVPAMPIGSAGMDGPEYGSRRDPYDVLLVQRDGSATVFQTYR